MAWTRIVPMRASGFEACDFRPNGGPARPDGACPAHSPLHPRTPPRPIVTRYLVTSALPYANGPIHFGHVAGVYLPADLYVRTLRMLGEEVLSICGTDEYGVAITLKAEQAGTPYPEYVRGWHEDIRGLFERLGVEFDIFSGTSQCEFHEETAQDFFRQLDAAGYLEKKETTQLYSEADEMFLADRYVTGTCYVCGYESARGDECPNCGTWIDPLKLIDPRSTLTGAKPVHRQTRHWYLDLPKLRDDYIGGWIQDHEWKPNVSAFIQNLLKDVPSRSITRDLKWGVPVPSELVGDETGKRLYVWFDAPIGYVSFTKELLAQRGEPDAWRKWWQDSDTRLVHFLGKDNIPFHCLVFPSMLWGTQQDYVLPWQVPANEFYNMEDGKFSTSEGRTFDLDAFFEQYDAEAVRFYIITTLPETSDSTFSLEQMVQTINSSLAANIGNLATRVLKFIGKNFDGQVPALAPAHVEEFDRQILTECGEIQDPAESIRAFRFREAAAILLANASVGNVFMQRTEPWAMRKTDPEKAASALNTLCEWIAWVARWMSPFLPNKSQALWEQLGLEGKVADQPWPGTPQANTWRQLQAGAPLGTPEALFPRVSLPKED